MTTRHHTSLPPIYPVDLDQLAKDIEPAPQPAFTPPPPPVTLQSGSDIGRLSADAVLEQYKMAAKSIETLGEDIQKRIRALESVMHECDADMKLLQEAADTIMDKGRLAHAEIERTTTVVREIREAVAAIKAKMA